jgi:hypothetical protein
MSSFSQLSRTALALVALVLILPLSMEATVPEEGSILEVPRAESPIELDGVLDEDAWAAALEFELRFEDYPSENTPAPVRTVAKITYDSGFVYFGFRCFDPEPSRIRAHYYERDRAWRDDRVGVLLDTFNDERRSIRFYVNPLGVQMDFISYAGTDDIGWDAIWDAACSIDDQGWTAEIAVPFSALLFQRTGGSQVWGFEPMRMYPRGVEHWLSSTPDDRNNNNRLSMVNKISGFADASPGRKIKITPTLTLQRTDARSDPAPGWKPATRAPNPV